jgi:hypothetical protein
VSEADLRESTDRAIAVVQLQHVHGSAARPRATDVACPPMELGNFTQEGRPVEWFHTRRRSFVAIGLASSFVLSSGVRAFSQPSTTFEQAYQTGTPITVRSALSMSVADDFAKRRSETVYAIRDVKTGRSFTLRLERTPSRRLRSGALVTVSGRAHGAVLYVPATQTQFCAQTDSTSALSASLATTGTAVVSGDQRTLVMLVNFSDTNLTSTPDAISDLMFSATSGISVDAIYRQSSSGTLSLSGGVVGPFTIPTTSTDPCDRGGWADAADAAAAAVGADPASYPRRVYALPSSSCPAAGIGDLGGASTRAWVFTCDLLDIYAHEFGHNFGMNHASTPTSEYGDYSDFMSSGLGRVRQVNGVHKLQMGSVDLSRIETVSEDGSYDVMPLELRPDGTNSLPQLLTIASPDGDGAFYLSYRRPIGVDSDLCCTYVDRLNVHRWAGGGPRSYLVATLGDGETFTDEATGFSVQQLGHEALASTARVRMGTSCVTAPTVSLSPRDQSGSAGASRIYDVSLVNNDGSGCNASAFAVAGNAPSGWGSVMSSANVQLAPGATAQLSWTLTPTASAAAGTYGVSLDTSDANTSLHHATAAGSYTVVQSCLAAPTLSLAPSSQTAAAGTQVTYSVSLTNHDGSACAPTTFTLVRTVPAGWSASLASSSLTLSPGATATTTYSVTSPGSASSGTYGVWASVSAGSTSVHQASTSGSYTIPAGDTIRPTAPGALMAIVKRRQVSLAWQPSTDNGGSLDIACSEAARCLLRRRQMGGTRPRAQAWLTAIPSLHSTPQGMCHHRATRRW